MDIHNILTVQKWDRDKIEYDNYLRMINHKTTSNDERLLTFEQYFKPTSIKHDYNDQTPTNKYIDEFEILDHKYVEKMSDFKDNELDLWKDILKEIYSEWDPNENIDGDLFGKDDYEDHYNQEIRIIRWLWRHNGKKDIDMMGWPGDTPSGGIILNNQIVLINSDQQIYKNKNTPEDLIDRIRTFKHIRIYDCTQNNDYVCHGQCLKVKEILDK